MEMQHSWHYLIFSQPNQFFHLTGTDSKSKPSKLCLTRFGLAGPACHKKLRCRRAARQQHQVPNSFQLSLSFKVRLLLSLLLHRLRSLNSVSLNPIPVIPWDCVQGLSKNLLFPFPRLVAACEKVVSSKLSVWRECLYITWCYKVIFHPKSLA